MHQLSFKEGAVRRAHRDQRCCRATRLSKLGAKNLTTSGAEPVEQAVINDDFFRYRGQRFELLKFSCR